MRLEFGAPMRPSPPAPHEKTPLRRRWGVALIVAGTVMISAAFSDNYFTENTPIAFLGPLITLPFLHFGTVTAVCGVLGIWTIKHFAVLRRLRLPIVFLAIGTLALLAGAAVAWPLTHPSNTMRAALNSLPVDHAEYNDVYTHYHRVGDTFEMDRIYGSTVASSTACNDFTQYLGDVPTNGLRDNRPAREHCDEPLADTHGIRGIDRIKTIKGFSVTADVWDPRTLDFEELGLPASAGDRYKDVLAGYPAVVVVHAQYPG